MVDVVLASSKPDAYQILMDLLSEKYQALVTDIQTDVRYEEGIAGVEVEVAKEAGMLVHKYEVLLFFMLHSYITNRESLVFTFRFNNNF